jgi:hypothetical protein
MLEIKPLSTNKIISCTVPIEINKLQEYFNDKEYRFEIDYNNSPLQRKEFLTYLSNLEIPSDLVSPIQLSYEIKSSLLYEYMVLPAITLISTLNLAVSSIIFRAKGYDLKDAYPNPYFSEEEADLFIEENNELIQKWITFLDSCTIYAQKSIPELNEIDFLTGGIEIIEDRNYIGHNVVNLFSLDFFFHNYYSKELGTLYYFKYQFDDRMFKGLDLNYYFFTKHNFIIGMFKTLGNDYSSSS